jgi:hypothetical protein
MVRDGLWFLEAGPSWPGLLCESLLWKSGSPQLLRERSEQIKRRNREDVLLGGQGNWSGKTVAQRETRTAEVHIRRTFWKPELPRSRGSSLIMGKNPCWCIGQKGGLLQQGRWI